MVGKEAVWVGCAVQQQQAGGPVTSHLARRLHILWLLLAQPDEHERERGALSTMAMLAEGKKKKDKAL